MFLNRKTELLFPLAVMAFVGPAVKYVNVIFNTSNRWAILILLAASLVMMARFPGGIQRSRPGFWIVTYIAWCMATSIWSESQNLSFSKSMALFLVAITFVSAGRVWVIEKGIEHSFSYLYPLLLLVLMAGIAGQWAQGSRDVVGRGVVLYSGLTDNPNMFGSMTAMAVPLLLWGTYREWGNQQQKLLWGGGLLLAFVFLLMAHSRASLITALLTSAGLLMALGLRKQLTLLLGGIILATVVLQLNPNIVSSFKTHYIYKSGSEETGVLNSRESVWEESYALAKQGGWLGGGYGVTIGETGFVGGLTAVGYGREKGNTQLAVWEETGLIGLALYGILIFTLLTGLASAYRWTQNFDLRIQLAIVLGMQIGVFAQSIVEAWWVAPGSPEAAYFWALTGISLGLIDQVKNESAGL